MKKEEDVKKILISIAKVGPLIKAIWEIGDKFTVLIDDTLEYNEELEEIKKSQDIIQFNKNKKLSIWWEMVRNGERKTLYELKNGKLFYDPAGYVRLFKKMYENEKLYHHSKKSQILFEKAKKSLDESEKILNENIKTEIVKALNDSAQCLLLYGGSFASTEKEISEKLKGINKVLFKLYNKAIQISEKPLNNFNDTENFLKITKDFIFDVENQLIYLEQNQKHDEIKKAYLFSINLCKKLIKEKSRFVPFDDIDRINLFKKYYGKEIHNDHFDTLNDLLHYNSLKKKKHLSEQKMKFDRNKLINLTLCLQDLSN